MKSTKLHLAALVCSLLPAFAIAQAPAAPAAPAAPSSPGAPATPAAPTEAEKTSKTLNEAYIAAFNKADAKALAALYAEDARYNSDSGENIVGRAQVQEGLVTYFRKNKGAKLEVN